MPEQPLADWSQIWPLVAPGTPQSHTRVTPEQEMNPETSRTRAEVHVSGRDHYKDGSVKLVLKGECVHLPVAADA